MGNWKHTCVHVLCGSSRSHLPSVNNFRSAIGASDDHEEAASQAGGCRALDALAQCCGYGCIHSVAALQQDVDACQADAY